VAPPPKAKAMTPRRTMNGNQDLFGADPFAPISKSFNVSIPSSTSTFSFSPSCLSQNLCTLDDPNQEFNGLDFSDESRNNVKDHSALSFQMNRFEDDLSDKVDGEFPSNSDSSRNPFLLQNDAPKKSSTKLFQKSSDMMMGGGKGSKYDVFKNEMVVNGQVNVPTPVQQQTIKTKTEASPDLFKDFAIAAFSEFKVEKTSMIHEFSNKLTDQRIHHQTGHQMMKVINQTAKNCERLCKCFSRYQLTLNSG
jgi:hypothetical protein